MLKWVGSISESHNTVKELVPVVISAAIWGHTWQGKSVQIHCDNIAVVIICQSGNFQEPGSYALS